jgi:phage terminase large subunit-like protein
MRREALKAQASPTYLPTFLRLALNRRTREQTRWLDISRWDECATPVIRAALRGRRAWGGLDLSAVSDLTAWAVWVEPIRPGAELELLVRFWLPEERTDLLEAKLQVPLRTWADRGWITLTEGDAVDYASVRSAVLGDCRHLDMQRISFDRMFAGQLTQELNSDLAGAVELAPVAQTFLGLSPACKELERLVTSRALRHGGHPVLRWHAAAVEIKNDGLDNIRPVKPDRRKSSKRIDGIQAAVTGLDGWLRRPGESQGSLTVWR